MKNSAIRIDPPKPRLEIDRVAAKPEQETTIASSLSDIASGHEFDSDPAGHQIVERLPCRWRPNASASGSDGNRSTANRGIAGRHDGGGGSGGSGNPDGFNEADLEADLREFVETLIDLLDPACAEVVRRAELLDQPPAKIAHEMGLSERTVASRLEVGRRALLYLVMLTLQPPSDA
ncbi:sigma factor-like helix-turn-helix DNA-binding protein [Aurantimonas sp. C2-6-R+9]|uniref:RNA polymerase sigma factor n=1 Tax=unclassified Aurantimonas TaxID=2638230 RepID=UPI002E179955|nr:MULTISPECIES: sigma factor-like helix-turn-helix DNA-binding protein [unclassified Aurantimonas]MEC5292877.1 sigma factor-like helix-turn-helix DNA-binding protein [Aurantimonas sp. C2-3-R2]MEC5382019.1 sigma factor-like helix-turn-helix DNA-binding protein [Aurantimonas sp. C2-6-R+9]MEC5413915.1 sigma factor-like helix-turn-helix DNA-binding protein [Aurantimonas sp. C2-4-R8]